MLGELIALRLATEQLIQAASPDSDLRKGLLRAYLVGSSRVANWPESLRKGYDEAMKAFVDASALAD